VLRCEFIIVEVVVKRWRSGKMPTRISAAKQGHSGDHRVVDVFIPTEPAFKAAFREGITAHLKQFALIGLQTQTFDGVSNYPFITRLRAVVRSERGHTTRADTGRLKQGFRGSPVCASDRLNVLQSHTGLPASS
jgi:hypothetical protein